jgi:hypothetical protein
MLGGRYERLRQYLAGLSFSEWRATFAQIEAILGFRLPPSARKHRAWWANDRRRSQPLAWLEVGWRTEQVDMGSERVVFRRDIQSLRRKLRSLTTPPQRPPAPAVRPDTEPGVRAEIQSSRCAFGFEWQSLGAVFLDQQGRLEFPRQQAVPALYRFQIRRDDREAWYIGETDNLFRRFSHYRNPGSTQRTNLRINALLVEELKGNAHVSVSAVTSGWVNRGQREAADLSSKVVRRMFENGALLDLSADGAEILNRDWPSFQALSAPIECQVAREQTAVSPVVVMSTPFTPPPRETLNKRGVC